MQKNVITVSTIVNAPIDVVWTSWVEPQHITKWCQASDDWHAPFAENDPKTGGKFKTTMAAKDGSFSFDFEGVYNKVDEKKSIEYDIADGRKVRITFNAKGDTTEIIETFEAENTHPVEFL